MNLKMEILRHPINAVEGDIYDIVEKLDSVYSNPETLRRDTEKGVNTGVREDDIEDFVKGYNKETVEDYTQQKRIETPNDEIKREGTSKIEYLSNNLKKSSVSDHHGFAHGFTGLIEDMLDQQAYKRDY